jgi:hypothetical protein
VHVTLQKEIEDGRKTVRADDYPMSIGEIANLYKDKELIIRPEFQRLFRWTLPQKSRLIESILLGIPLPSVFVMQRDDGVWEVIDGLQRLSTILEFMGELRDESTGLTLPPSRLQATEYLPTLEGVSFDENPEKPHSPSFTSGQRINFKRSKLDVNILLPESDEKAKYELFDRLNTGGSTPTAQEIRNAQLIMRDPSFFDWMDKLRRDENFQNCISISDRRYDEGYDAELVTRFLVLLNTSETALKGLKDIDTFLSRQIFSFIDNDSFKRRTQERTFRNTFKILNDAAGDDSFRRYDKAKKKFLGPFSVSAFEVVTVGVGSDPQAWKKEETENSGLLQERIQGLWSNEIFKKRSGSGISSAQRIPYTVPEAQKYFSVK